MIRVRTEVVLVFEEDGHKEAVLFQNGVIEIYRLNRATKEHVAQLLNADKVEEK